MELDNPYLPPSFTDLGAPDPKKHNIYAFIYKPTNYDGPIEINAKVKCPKNSYENRQNKKYEMILNFET